MNGSRTLVLALMLIWPALARGQETLGAVLDAGASRLSPPEFRAQVEQRMVAGPLPSGGSIELMYASNGTVVGRGRNPTFFGPNAPVEGAWKFDAQGRVCASMRTNTFEFPLRCQFWFRLGDKYFLADSDTDRSAKVLLRTITQ